MSGAHVRGALVCGPAAAALAVVLDPEQIAAELRERGYSGRWIAEAAAAVEAIHYEGRVVARAMLDRRRHQPGSANGTQTGSVSVPQRETVASSEAMTTASAARTLSMSEGYVRRLARRGDLPARRDGRDWLLNVDAVNELALARAGQGTAARRGRRPSPPQTNTTTDEVH